MMPERFLMGHENIKLRSLKVFRDSQFENKADIKTVPTGTPVRK